MTTKSMIVKRLAVASGAVLLTAGIASASISVEGGGGPFGAPGWDTPPATLGGWNMKGYDNFDPFLAVFQDTTTATSDSSVAHETFFSSTVNHRHIGSGWATWSGGYNGSVYYTSGATSVTLSFTPKTVAYSLMFEPNPFAVHNFTLTGTDTAGNSVNLTQDADGSSGATWAGFYTDGSTFLDTITITSDTDFAIGRFSYQLGEQLPAPGALALLGIAGLVGTRRRRN